MPFRFRNNNLELLLHKANESNDYFKDSLLAIPVFIKLGDGMNPWQLTPNPAYRYEIPEAYGDSTKLYNLDEIFIEKSNEEIISDLRGMFSGPVFDSCMNGFAGLTRVVVPGNSLPVSTAKAPVRASNVTKIPSPGGTVTPALSSVQLPPEPDEEVVEEEVEVAEEAPPVATKKLNSADLKNFLKANKSLG